MKAATTSRQPPNREAAMLASQAAGLERAGQVEDARKIYERLLEIDRRNPALFVKLGILASRRGDFHAGVSYFSEAAKLDPKSPHIRNNLATVLIQIGRLDQAQEQALTALKADGNSLDTLRILFDCAIRLGQPAKARAFIDKALALKPDDPRLLMDMAHSFDMSAEPDKARELYQRLVDAGHASPPTYSALARVQTYSTEPPEFAVIEKMAGDARFSPYDRALLHQAAGKIDDDLGRYGEAFAHFSAARARLLGAGHSARPADVLETYRSFFTRRFFEDRKDFGSTSNRPVFVFGMPRSGTTLVEQILASHPKVHGAGELGFMGYEADRLSAGGPSAGGPSAGGKDIAEAAQSVSAAQSREIAGDYLSLLAAHSPDAARVTDKMPHNFERLWLLALLFPNASFIHCRREPMATCVSCFVQPLNQFHTYASDLGKLGSYYRAYEDLMAFWHDTLPVPILDVSYEALVRDQESQSRRMIEHVGLEWDPACLQFHKTKRSVHTPSRRQVEQPIHTNAIDSWRRYEPWLGPLFDALGDLAPPRS
jgi:Flp pilus assembly protein TadD